MRQTELVTANYVMLEKRAVLTAKRTIYDKKKKYIYTRSERRVRSYNKNILVDWNTITVFNRI